MQLHISFLIVISLFDLNLCQIFDIPMGSDPSLFCQPILTILWMKSTIIHKHHEEFNKACKSKNGLLDLIS